MVTSETKLPRRHLAALLAATLTFSVVVLGEAGDSHVVHIPVTAAEVPDELRTIRVPQGSELTLRWEGDVKLDLHLHGYDVHVTAKPGEIAEMSFHAHATGRFPVEAHANGGHRRILYIEVHPE